MLRRRMLRELVEDAVEMTRACALPVRRGTLLRTVLLTDSYPFMAMNRVREACRRHKVPFANRLLRYAQMTLFGAEVGKEVELGRGVYFVHTIGTVVGGTSRIGDRVRIMGNNTIGTAKDNGCPVIEEDVVIGCGARVLGPIRIGARSQIGANAVVLQDVPPDSIATGIPAVVRPNRARVTVAPAPPTEVTPPAPVAQPPVIATTPYDPAEPRTLRRGG